MTRRPITRAHKHAHARLSQPQCREREQIPAHAVHRIILWCAVAHPLIGFVLSVIITESLRFGSSRLADCLWAAWAFPFGAFAFSVMPATTGWLVSVGVGLLWGIVIAGIYHTIQYCELTV